ncbi:hypothetical protein diail_9018, partial [Diaporthe ilicicola]
MADPAFVDDDDDVLDSAAMAEAMGFTGFGMQARATKKRKLTPPAQTGPNSAPLGKRRPLNLPQPVSASGGGGGNAEEIDLDGDEEEEEVVVVEDDEQEENARAQAGIGALTVSDGPPHHQLPPRPPPTQQQHHPHQAGKAGRFPGGLDAGGGGGRRAIGAGPQWWEGEWDPRLVERMVENPWDRLERQRGLEARGAWPSKGVVAGGGGDAAAAAGLAGAGPAGTGGGAFGSLGSAEAAAQATVS